MIQLNKIENFLDRSKRISFINFVYSCRDFLKAILIEISPKLKITFNVIKYGSSLI
jgi:hypothetical protein